MKKIALILVTLLAVSCAKNKEFVNHSGTELPEWVMNPAVENGIGAVGIASPSQGGIKFQLGIAELDAKGSIAVQLGSEISRITKNALRSAKVNENDDVEEFFAQATKEVANSIPLSGVIRDKFFCAKDGTLYVHVVLRKGEYNSFLRDNETKLANKLKKSNLGRENINKSQEAVKEIFSELDTEIKE